MEKLKLIGGLFLILTAAVAFLLLRLYSSGGKGGARLRESRGRPSRRKADTRKLTYHEKSVYKEAQKHLRKGMIAQGAQLLESIGMAREAITVLEEHGFIADAAKILMRMGRHNRAGVIFARHGQWAKAAESFKLANMPLEAGKCLREIGQFKQAAEFFFRAEKFEASGECFVRAQDYHLAAKAFLRAKANDKAIAAYSKLAHSAINVSAIKIAEEEVRFISGYLSEGYQGPGLYELLIARNQHGAVVKQLVEKGLLVQATELLLQSPNDLGPYLLSDVNPDEQTSRLLGELFTKAEKYKYAGMVYERIKAFDLAADCFERAGDYSRASYCFERAGFRDKARELASIQRTGQNFQAAEGSAKSGKFALSSVTRTELDAQNGTATDQGAATDATGSSSAGHGGGGNDSEESMSDLDLNLLRIVNEPELDTPSDDSQRQAFAKAGLFDALSEVELDKLWKASTLQRFQTGSEVLEYDAVPEGYYVVVSGKIDCFRRKCGQELHVDSIDVGDTFGELWLLMDQPTSVRFLAHGKTEIRLVPRAAFNRLVDIEPAIAKKLYRKLTSRLIGMISNTPKRQDKRDAS